MKKKALISLSSKVGSEDFARELVERDYDIISTGGTAAFLRQAGIPITDVSELTCFPEIMDGRVKTLHPLIHGGILYRRTNPSDTAEAITNNIYPIDIVCVNLYPFVQVSANPLATPEEIIENIDIGGPAMLRAAAKNHRFVTVICDPNDYSSVMEEIKTKQCISIETNQKLAAKAFKHTARYDAAIAEYLSGTVTNTVVPEFTDRVGKKLRYGENPHQEAALYRFGFPGETIPSLADAEILNGKEMSFNNYQDVYSAVSAIALSADKEPLAAVVKHNNPCGYANGKSIAEALAMAWEGDPISAFGGVIATNCCFTLEAAKFLKSDEITHYSYRIENGKNVAEASKTGKFVEIIAAPDFEPDALAYLKQKSKAVRLIKFPVNTSVPRKLLKQITGALLIQDNDTDLLTSPEIKTVASFPFPIEQILPFGVNVTRQLVSNSISIIREYEPGYYMLLGMGAGQPNRIDAICKLAVPKALENLEREYSRKKISTDFSAWAREQLGKTVLFSDAFFPFDDSVREAARLGIRFIVQPGGSNRDGDSIKACNELGVAMAFTGIRHFKH